MKNRFIRRAFLPVIFTFSSFFSLTGSISAQTSPSYTWKNVKIVAGGFIIGIIPHPTVPGLMYVRTDTGGAYRYDANLARWTPLTDVFNAADWNLLGTESIALGPSSCNAFTCDPKAASFGWWIGALAADPFDSNHVLHGTDATIWETYDVTNVDSRQMTHWTVSANGIEETAVLALVSPPSGPAHLISRVGDIAGFRHDDVTVSPLLRRKGW